jgi:cephalosporin-C deacetylase-like acetyl esterase
MTLGYLHAIRVGERKKGEGLVAIGLADGVDTVPQLTASYSPPEQKKSSRSNPCTVWTCLHYSAQEELLYWHLYGH